MYADFIKEFWVEAPPLEAMLGVEGAKSALAHSEDSVKGGGKRLVSAQAAASLAFAREEEREIAEQHANDGSFRKKSTETTQETDDLLSLLLDDAPLKCSSVDSPDAKTKKKVNSATLFGSDSSFLFAEPGNNIFGENDVSVFDSPSKKKTGVSSSDNKNNNKAGSKNIFGDDDDDFMATVTKADQRKPAKKATIIDVRD